MFFNFLGADFLVPKTGRRREKQSILGTGKLVVMIEVKMSKDNKIVDHLEKCGLFFDFQYGFRYSRSTADLPTVLSDRISRAT